MIKIFILTFFVSTIFCNISQAIESRFYIEDLGQVKRISKNQQEIDYNLRAGEVFAKNDLNNAAIIAFQKVTAMDPYNIEAYEWLGKLALKIKNWAYAITIYERLITISPINKDYYNTLFFVYNSFEMDREALRIAKTILRFEPKNKKVLLKAIVISDKNYWLEEEKGLLEKYIQLEPEAKKMQIRLAKVCSSLGDIGRAIKIYNILLEKDSKNLDYLKYLAKLYGDCSDFEGQIKIYEKIAKYYPNKKKFMGGLARTYYLHGLFYIDREDYYLASLSFKKAVDISPKSEKYSLAYKKSLRMLNPKISLEHLFEKYTINKAITREHSKTTLDYPFKSVDAAINVCYGFIDTFQGNSRERIDYYDFYAWYNAGSNIRFKAGLGLNDKNELKKDIVITWYPVNNIQTVYHFDHSLVTDTPNSINRQISYDSHRLEVSGSLFNKFDYYTSFKQSIISDANKINELSANLYFNLLNRYFAFSKQNQAEYPDFGTLYKLTLGYSYSYSNSKFNSNDYYTPQKLIINGLSIDWEQSLFERFSYKLGCSFNVNNDQSKYVNYVGRIAYDMKNKFKIFTEINHSRNAQPGLVSNDSDYTVNAGVDYRF